MLQSAPDDPRGGIEPRCQRPHVGTRASNLRHRTSVPPTGAANLTNLIETMHDADFVVIDGAVFETEYLRVPDEFTVADDIVLEAKRGTTEIELTRAEIDDAEYVGEGVYRLK